MEEKSITLKPGSAIGLAGVIAHALLVASAAFMLSACTPSGLSTLEPPTPLSNVTPDMLNPDGTFRKNGLSPVDPGEQS